jgi:SAM-dependent methyltransferase
MRSYWDEAARTNAAWYVDTSLDYDDPDMKRFFETGRVVVAEALDGAPTVPAQLGTAVEIGPGLGRICVALAERFEHVIGIDISAEMISRAEQLVHDPNIRFVLGDGRGLAGIDDASADFVVSFTVLQHIPSFEVIETYLREAGRVLRPGGVFAFQWNNQPGAHWWQVRRTLLSLLQRSGILREPHGRHAPEFLGSRVPLDRMRRALESGGLELVGTRSLGTLFAWAWASKPAGTPRP